MCVCVFQIHSRVPPLALFPGPSERGRRCPLPHCKEEPQAEMHFFIKTPSREELQRGWQLSGPVPIQDSLGTHLDHDVHLVLEILCRPSWATATSLSLWENMVLRIGSSYRLLGATYLKRMLTQSHFYSPVLRCFVSAFLSCFLSIKIVENYLFCSDPQGCWD